MLDRIESAFSPEWRPAFHVLALPVAWIPTAQGAIIAFLWYSPSLAIVWAKLVFLLLPAVFLVTGIWCTMLAIYTLPFRSGRSQFIAAILQTWWDGARAVLSFWAGIGRFAFLALGWLWGVVRILLAGLYLALAELLTLPLSLLNRATKSYLQPGIPWIALTLTLFWSLLEAGVFSFTLLPTMSELVGDLMGTESTRFLQPILFVMLFFLISGSFACLQVLVEAIERRRIKEIIQMVIVEVFVMFIEVLFLYRELVDAITPWLAQESGGEFRMGVVAVISISALAWVGVRGMTWFLFARYGTPTLLAIISRQGLAEGTPGAQPAAAVLFAWTKQVIGHVKEELDWFHAKGAELVEAFVLPPLQVLAATINFLMLLLTAHHLFTLPLKSLEQIMETTSFIKTIRASGAPVSREAGGG
jgi:hypothetical protein